MGTGWSQQSSPPEISEDSSQGSSTSRKRSRSDENGDDNNSSAEAPEARQKKRRRVSSAWDSFSDFVTSWVAKGFLVAAEWATHNAKQGELAEEQDIIHALLQMLDYFQASNMDILRRGWRVLCFCSSAPAPPVEPVLDSDIATVVTAMKRHSKSIKIQLLGCRALRTLVQNSGENWEGLCHAGAVHVFLQALRNFPDDLVMQGLAITFVAMVIREEGEFPRRQALGDGAIQLVLEAMRRFDDDPRLLHTGCYALHQLGFIRQSRTMILTNGGMEVLLHAVRRHMDDVSLTDLCLNALSKLSDENNLAGLGAVPLILESMERWPNEQAIQGHNLVLILRVVGHETIPKQQCIKLILSAMRRFPKSASLQFFACATLREMLQRTNGREALEIVCAEGGIECVLTAIKNHRGIFGLQPMALLFLLHIFEQQQPEQETAITAFGGSEDAVALLAALRMDLDHDVAEIHI